MEVTGDVEICEVFLWRIREDLYKIKPVHFLAF